MKRWFFILGLLGLTAALTVLVPSQRAQAANLGGSQGTPIQCYLVPAGQGLTRTICPGINGSSPTDISRPVTCYYSFASFRCPNEPVQTAPPASQVCIETMTLAISSVMNGNRLESTSQPGYELIPRHPIAAGARYNSGTGHWEDPNSSNNYVTFRPEVTRVGTACAGQAAALGRQEISHNTMPVDPGHSVDILVTQECTNCFNRTMTAVIPVDTVRGAGQPTPPPIIQPPPPVLIGPPPIWKPTPIVLTATPQCTNDRSTVQLTWQGGQGASTVVVWRGGPNAGSAGGWERLQTYSGREAVLNVFTDTTVTAGQQYQYTIEALAYSGQQTLSPNVPVTAADCGQPGSMTVSGTLVCSNERRVANIQWQPLANVTSYQVMLYEEGVTSDFRLAQTVGPGTVSVSLPLTELVGIVKVQAYGLTPSGVASSNVFISSGQNPCLTEPPQLPATIVVKGTARFSITGLPQGATWDRLSFPELTLNGGRATVGIQSIVPPADPNSSGIPSIATTELELTEANPTVDLSAIPALSQYDSFGILVTLYANPAQTATPRVPKLTISAKPAPIPPSPTVLLSTASRVDGQPGIGIVLRNDGPGAIELANAAPYKVTTLGGETVFTPIGAAQVVSLTPSQERFWSWDFTDDEGKPVGAGGYLVTLTYTFTGVDRTVQTRVDVAETQSGGTEPSSATFLYFNGSPDTSGSFNIGVATQADDRGLKWTVHSGNPIIPRGKVKDPYALSYDNQYLLYFSDYNTPPTIGLAMSTDGLTYAYQGAVLQLGSPESWDDEWPHFFPSVYVDPDERDASKKFKMFYTGYDGSHWRIGLAYSPDGRTWTKYLGNQCAGTSGNGCVIDYDPAKAHENVGIGVCSDVVKAASQYAMQCAGLGDNDKWQTVLIQFDSFEGPYTKSAGPIIARRSSAQQTLASPAAAGATTLKIADTSVFEVGESVFVASANEQTVEQRRVAAKPSSQQLTLDQGLTNAYSTGSTVRSWLAGSNSPRTFRYENGKWKMWATAFQAIDSYYREQTFYAESDQPDRGWQLDYANSPYLKHDEWNSASAENPHIVSTPTQSAPISTVSGNVLDHDAKCNGRTDDTAAVREAIDAVLAAGGGTITFPSDRTCRVSSIVKDGSNLTLEGNGVTLVSNLTTDNAAPVLGINGSGNIIQNFTIEYDQELDIASGRNAGTQGTSLWLGSNGGDEPFARGATIQNNTVRNSPGMCMMVTFSHDVLIKDNRCEGAAAVGIFTGNLGDRILIEGNTVSDTGDDGIFAETGPYAPQPQHELVIRGNTVTRSNAKGIGLSGARNPAIANNTIDGTAGSGIVIESDDSQSSAGIEGASIHGNTLRNIGFFNDHRSEPLGDRHGIRVVVPRYRVTDLTIVNNTLEHVAMNGIAVNGVENLLIESNRLSDIDASGISLGFDRSEDALSVNGYTVAENTLENLQLNGIYLSKVTDGVITGNHISDYTKAGLGYGDSAIVFYHADTATYRDNVIRNTNQAPHEIKIVESTNVTGPKASNADPESESSETPKPPESETPAPATEPASPSTNPFTRAWEWLTGLVGLGDGGEEEPTLGSLEVENTAGGEQVLVVEDPEATESQTPVELVPTPTEVQATDPTPTPVTTTGEIATPETPEAPTTLTETSPTTSTSTPSTSKETAAEPSAGQRLPGQVFQALETPKDDGSGQAPTSSASGSSSSGSSSTSNTSSESSASPSSSSTTPSASSSGNNSSASPEPISTSTASGRPDSLATTGTEGESTAPGQSGDGANATISGSASANPFVRFWDWLLRLFQLD